MQLFELLQGDCTKVLATLPAASIQCCVTSPPYWGLRNYNVDGQLGLEETPKEYVANMVSVFREVRRVLRNDGTLWLNLGDSYAGNNSRASNNGRAGFGIPREGVFERTGAGLKSKDLVGIPWRVAFALQADGWYLRQDIIWHKPNPMPESVTDRCTKAHEYIFLLTKSQKYAYDAEAIKEPSISFKDVGDGKATKIKFGGNKYGDSDDPKHQTKSGNEYTDNGKRNKRSVWTVTTKPYSEAHFATFPPELIEPCILAGSAPDTLVLDPFNGAGTTGVVSIQNSRRYIGIELNPEYLEMSRKRIQQAWEGITLPLFG